MNDKPKFTPGPWKVSGTTVLSEKHDSALMDEVWAHDDTEETQIANVNLIASAPDLYEACKHALESFGGLRPEAYAQASRKEYDLLSAAIQKAEGTKP